MAASINFTYQDAVDQARELLNDDALRSWTDEDIRVRYLPRVLQQLRNDRPDVFLGAYSFDPKPVLSAACAFDDMGFNAFVEALVAAIEGSSNESVSSGQAKNADQRSERAKRQ